METNTILAVISIALMLFLVGPTALRFNMARGTTLRNIALWLLIFVGLVWAYRLTHDEPTVQADALFTEETNEATGYQPPAEDERMPVPIAPGSGEPI
jgi:hypothetical protein